VLASRRYARVIAELHRGRESQSRRHVADVKIEPRYSAMAEKEQAERQRAGEAGQAEGSRQARGQRRVREIDKSMV